MGLGNIKRPTEGFRTELVKTKSDENQTFGLVLEWDRTAKYYKIAGASTTNPNKVVVVDTTTNVGSQAANADIAGIREVLKRDWEVTLKAGGAIPVGSEVKCGANGTVVAWVPGTDTDRGTVVGEFIKKESEEFKDVTAALTDAANNDLIIVRKYAASQ